MPQPLLRDLRMNARRQKRGRMRVAEGMKMDPEAEALRQPAEEVAEHIRANLSAVRLSADQRVRSLTDAKAKQLLGLVAFPLAQLVEGRGRQGDGPRITSLRRATE